ncbi:hypothetical protein [Micromonospora cathayae]|uniref:Uncharacterized protein n=1 Tax=Micromonospora cathayae TaxID=3028804 RepID=A0ABY7ZH01_9ACTN|nr:hypothetical protein [Micromonospora sp. HUAS 3]WDZ82264.1 hypothetical protein PVK37_17335 [Micromonospora sp. HUAS 3]
MRATVIVGAAALAGTLLGGAPAQAATCTAGDPCDTVVTFDITAGALTITVPDTATLTTQAPSGTPTTWYAFGQLGAVTVNDLRATDPASWTVTVTNAGGFTHSTTGPAIPNTNVYYCSGNATATTGDGTFTPGQASPCDPPPPPDGTAIGTGATAFTHTGGSGINSATWNPSLTVAIPLTAVTGTYTGTITHTVV